MLVLGSWQGSTAYLRSVTFTIKPAAAGTRAGGELYGGSKRPGLHSLRGWWQLSSQGTRSSVHHVPALVARSSVGGYSVPLIYLTCTGVDPCCSHPPVPPASVSFSVPFAGPSSSAGPLWHSPALDLVSSSGYLSLPANCPAASGSSRCSEMPHVKPASRHYPSPRR